MDVEQIKASANHGNRSARQQNLRLWNQILVEPLPLFRTIPETFRVTAKRKAIRLHRNRNRMNDILSPIINRHQIAESEKMETRTGILKMGNGSIQETLIKPC